MSRERGVALQRIVLEWATKWEEPSIDDADIEGSAVSRKTKTRWLEEADVAGVRFAAKALLCHHPDLLLHGCTTPEQALALCWLFDAAEDIHVPALSKGRMLSALTIPAKDRTRLPDRGRLLLQLRANVSSDSMIMDLLVSFVEAGDEAPSPGDYLDVGAIDEIINHPHTSKAMGGVMHCVPKAQVWVAEWLSRHVPWVREALVPMDIRPHRLTRPDLSVWPDLPETHEESGVFSLLGHLLDAVSTNPGPGAPSPSGVARALELGIERVGAERPWSMRSYLDDILDGSTTWPATLLSEVGLRMLKGHMANRLAGEVVEPAVVELLGEEDPVVGTEEGLHCWLSDSAGIESTLPSATAAGLVDQRITGIIAGLPRGQSQSAPSGGRRR